MLSYNELVKNVSGFVVYSINVFILLTAVVVIIANMFVTNIIVNLLDVVLRFTATLVIPGLIIGIELFKPNLDNAIVFSHFISLGTTYLASLTYMYFFRSFSGIKHELFILAYITLILIFSLYKLFLEAKNRNHTYKVSKDYIIVIALNAVLASSIILFPNYLVSSHDTPMDLLTAVSAAHLIDRIKEYNIPIIVTPFHIILMLVIGDNYSFLPPAVFTLILLTSMQHIVLYHILKKVSPTRIALVSYIVGLTGISSITLIQLFLNKYLFLPNAMAPLIPESFSRYMIRYKYFYDSLYATLLLLYLIFDKRNNIVNKSCVGAYVISLFLGLCAALHSVVVILYTVPAVIVSLVYTLYEFYAKEKATFYKHIMMLLLFSSGVTLSILLFNHLDVTNANVALRFTLMIREAIVKLAVSHIYRAFIDLKLANMSFTVLFTIILLCMLYRICSMYKHSIRIIIVLIVISFLLASLITSIRQDYYEIYAKSCKSLAWVIAPPPPLFITLLSIPLMLVTIGIMKTKNATLLNLSIIIVFLSLLSYFASIFTGFEALAFRFFLPLQFLASLHLILFLKWEMNRNRVILSKVINILKILILILIVTSSFMDAANVWYSNYKNLHGYDWLEDYYSIDRYILQNNISRDKVIFLSYRPMPGMIVSVPVSYAFCFTKFPTDFRLFTDYGFKYLVLSCPQTHGYVKFLEAHGYIKHFNGILLLNIVECDCKGYCNASKHTLITDNFLYIHNDELITKYKKYLSSCLKGYCVCLIIPYTKFLKNEYTPFTYSPRCAGDCILVKKILINASTVTIISDKIFEKQCNKTKCNISLYPFRELNINNAQNITITSAISSYYVEIKLNKNRLIIVKTPTILLENFTMKLESPVTTYFLRGIRYHSLIIRGSSITMEHIYSIRPKWASSYIVIKVLKYNGIKEVNYPEMSRYVSLEINSLFIILQYMLIILLILMTFYVLFPINIKVKKALKNIIVQPVDAT